MVSGSSCSFSVVFTPSTGANETASLVITDSASDSPLTVALTGTGLPQSQILDLSANEITFTAQNIGTTSAQSALSVYNFGDVTLTFTGFTITGANAGDFSISQNSCGTTLTPGAGCTIYVKFSPSLVDAESATLQIADTATGSPQLVSLFGTGQTPVSQITFTYSSLNFGAQTVGTTSTQHLNNIYNYGNTVLNLTNFSIGGTNASEFAISANSCGSTLAIGSACTVNVTFNPAATGQRVAFLQVTDSAIGSPQVVNLYGTGQ